MRNNIDFFQKDPPESLANGNVSGPLWIGSLAKSAVLEELTEDTCKYMDHDVHPNEPNATFCGRKTVSNPKQKFSYCPLHLMIIFQPKNKKEDVVDKDDEVPQFIEKKIKSA